MHLDLRRFVPGHAALPQVQEGGKPSIKPALVAAMASGLFSEGGKGLEEILNLHKHTNRFARESLLLPRRRLLLASSLPACMMARLHVPVLSVRPAPLLPAGASGVPLPHFADMSVGARWHYGGDEAAAALAGQAREALARMAEERGIKATVGAGKDGDWAWAGRVGAKVAGFTKSDCRAAAGLPSGAVQDGGQVVEQHGGRPQPSRPGRLVGGQAPEVSAGGGGPARQRTPAQWPRQAAKHTSQEGQGSLGLGGSGSAAYYYSSLSTVSISSAPKQRYC